MAIDEPQPRLVRAYNFPLSDGSTFIAVLEPDGPHCKYTLFYIPVRYSLVAGIMDSGLSMREVRSAIRKKIGELNEQAILETLEGFKKVEIDDSNSSGQSPTEL